MTILILILTSIIFLYLSGAYLDMPSQAFVTWSLFFLLIILKRFKAAKEPFGRLFFLLVATFISMRYWVWRSTETLFYIGFFDFIFMITLYFAETYSLIIHFLGMFVNIWPLNRKPIPLPNDTELLPTIDIFIPTYTEPEEIVRVTATAATFIDYPRDKLRIHILDDGSTIARRNHPVTAAKAIKRHQKLQDLARELDIQYLTREKNDHAKAGNINTAMTVTNADLILFLDCDHVPTRDILKNTVGYFLKDPKLFVVQTPHFFINPDPVEKNLATFAEAPGENFMFYGAIQRGLDFWNSSYFCGSAGLIRRKYLEAMGGFKEHTITEDAETSLSLHAKGYNSVYLAKPMVCGLSPETFDSMILQRSRWATGMVQIFILNNPFIVRGLKWFQRLSYINSTFFWFFGFARFIFLLAPAAYLILGLKIYNASAEQILAYAIPHVIAVFLVSDFLYGDVRWPFFGEIYESVQSFFLVSAVLSTIKNPRMPRFKVTPKGAMLQEDTLSKLAGPFYVMFFLILATFPAAVIRWIGDPFNRDVIVICALWSFLNLLFSLACLGIMWETRQIRRYHRAWSKGKVYLFFPRLDIRTEGDIEDLSLAGIGLKFRLPKVDLIHGEEVIIEAGDSYGNHYEFGINVLRIQKKGSMINAGGDFIISNRETSNNLIRFVYGDSQRWLDFWQKKAAPPGLMKGMVYMIAKGIEGFRRNIQGISYGVFLTIKESVELIIKMPFSVLRQTFKKGEIQ